MPESCGDVVSELCFSVRMGVCKVLVVRSTQRYDPCAMLPTSAERACPLAASSALCRPECLQMLRSRRAAGAGRGEGKQTTARTRPICYPSLFSGIIAVVSIVVDEHSKERLSYLTFVLFALRQLSLNPGLNTICIAAPEQ